MSEQREAGCWLLEKEIGSGSFAKVWKATHKQTQQVAAVKEINLDKLSKKLQERLASEVAVLKHTQHHNIVCLLDLIKVGTDATKKQPAMLLGTLTTCYSGLAYWLQYRTAACAPDRSVVLS